MTKSEERIAFRYRMAELENKLRKSEEERLILEEKFGIMMKSCREEEEARLSVLRAKYEQCLEMEKRRKGRNEQIMQTLERIENRSLMITAKSERLQQLKKHYEAYLASMYPAWNGNLKKPADHGMPAPQRAPDTRHETFERTSSRVSNDSQLFPLNPVKGSYISPHSPVQPPYLLPDVRVNYEEPDTLIYAPAIPTLHELKPTDNVTSYSSLKNATPIPKYSRTPIEVSSIFPTPMNRVERDEDLQRFANNDEEYLKRAANEYRRRNLFPDEPFKFQEKESPLPFDVATPDDNNTTRNQTNIQLTEYIEKAAKLLNYKRSDQRIVDSQENKAANSLELELEQNTSGDLLNMSLSDDGMINPEPADYFIGPNEVSTKQSAIPPAAKDSFMEKYRTSDFIGRPRGDEYMEGPEGGLFRAQEADDNIEKLKNFMPRNYGDTNGRSQVQRGLSQEYEKKHEVVENYQRPSQEVLEIERVIPDVQPNIDRSSKRQQSETTRIEDMHQRQPPKLTEQEPRQESQSEINQPHLLQLNRGNRLDGNKDQISYQEINNAEFVNDGPLDQVGDETQGQDIYKPQGQEGYEPQGQEGYEPQGQEGYEPQGQEGYEPQGQEGYEPQGQEGYEPQGQEGYEPQGAEEYEPQGQEGYEPQGQEGYEPQGQEGYEPQGADVYETQHQDGYGPQDNERYENEDDKAYRGDVPREYIEDDQERYQAQDGYSVEKQEQDEYNVDGQAGYGIEGQEGYTVEGQGEYEADGNEGYVVEGQQQYVAEGQKGYTIEDQGGYVVEGQEGYGGEGQEGYVVEGQEGYGVEGQEGYTVERQGGYGVEGQEGYTMEGQGVYVVEGQEGYGVEGQEGGYTMEGQGGNVVEGQEGYGVEGYNGEGQDGYIAEGQEGYLMENQEGYTIEGQGEYVAESQEGYVMEGQQEYVTEGQEGYVVQGQGEYEAEHQEGYGVEGYNVESQGEYLEEGQRYVVEGQEGYGVEGQYSTDDQRQYGVDSQGDNDVTQEQTYEQQYGPQDPNSEFLPDQQYGDEEFEINPTQPTDNYDYQQATSTSQHQQDIEYFRDGKYHEPTVGYEKGKSNQVQDVVGEDGTTTKRNQPESDDLLQHDVSTRSPVAAERITVEKSPSTLPTQPRKSGLAMLESDTESSLQLENASMSNDDSDFDFSSEK